MVYLATTSGHLLLVCQREGTDPNQSVALAVTPLIQIINIHHRLLATTTIVSQEIQLTCMFYIYFTVMIYSGMVSSVKVSAAVMENLPHG